MTLEAYLRKCLEAGVDTPTVKILKDEGSMVLEFVFLSPSESATFYVSGNYCTEVSH